MINVRGTTSLSMVPPGLIYIPLSDPDTKPKESPASVFDERRVAKTLSSGERGNTSEKISVSDESFIAMLTD